MKWVKVWHDKTSGDPAWIVSLDDDDDTTTIADFPDGPEGKRDAETFAARFAARREVELRVQDSPAK